MNERAPTVFSPSVESRRVPRQAAKRARETLTKVTEDIRLKDLPETLLNPPEVELEEGVDAEDWADAGTEVGLAAPGAPGAPVAKEPSAVKPSGRQVPGVSREELHALFRYTAAEAATKLGVPTATLKKICRAHGIDRWPHQKPHQDKKLGGDMPPRMFNPGVGGMAGGVGHQGALDFWNRHLLAQLRAGQVPGLMAGQGRGQEEWLGGGHGGPQPGVQHSPAGFGRGSSQPGMRAPPGMGSPPSMGAGLSGMASGYGHMANMAWPSISPELHQGPNREQSDRALIQSLSHQVSSLKDMMEVVNQRLLTLMVLMQDKASKDQRDGPQDAPPQGKPFVEAAPVRQSAGFSQDPSTFSTLMDQMRHLVDLHAKTKMAAGEPK